MSALSEVERIDRERKSILKNQIISGMMEDSALQKSLKKARQKAIDFAQQTKTQARQVEYSAKIRRQFHGNLGGFRNLAQPGLRDPSGRPTKSDIFRGGASSAREYGKGLTRSASGAFQTTASVNVSDVAVDRLKEKQKWTTSGYRDVDTGPIFGKGYGPEQLETVQLGTGEGATSELRRRSRLRLREKATGRQFTGSSPFGGMNLGEYGHIFETPEERRRSAERGGASYAPERSAAGASYANLGLDR
jgi:hypothetical protein